MLSLKDRISSPLEAGTSILDAHHLPPHMTSALDYASKRLARKNLHVTLVVVRRDYQLPGVEAPPEPSPAILSPPITPAPVSAVSTPRSSFAPVAAIKQLVRSGTHPNLASLEGRSNVKALQRSKTVSPIFSPSTSVDTSSPRLRWPLSPMSPASMPRTPKTPRTPATPATSVTASSTTGTDTSCGLPAPTAFGLRLIHASPLNLRIEKILTQVMERTQKKFRIGIDWLPIPVSPATYGLPPYLIQRSIVQNETLFSSDGLTLLSLCHLYTFKSALASYTGTGSVFRLEDSVDELRRYVLSNGRRKLQKSFLLRSYEWLRMSDAALSDVSRMYRRAYGGAEKDSGIENDIEVVPKPKPMSPKPLPEEPLSRDQDEDVTDIEEDDDDDDGEDVVTPVKAIPTPKETPVPTTPPPAPSSSSPAHKTPSPNLKGPALRLQTTFDKPIRRISPPQQRVDAGEDIKIDLLDMANEEDEDADAELTARPSSNAHRPAFPPWSAISIDEVMFSPMEARTPHNLGPMTPNDYDDISPVTRGEWGFLMVGDSWKAKTAAVETC